MYKRILIAVLMVTITGTAVIRSQSTGNNFIDVILSAWSPRMFTSEQVSDHHLDLIVQCGIKTPSAGNRQPWKFTVVKDNALAVEAINGTLPGNVLIFVSAPEDNLRADLDCALATENMFLAAHSLGLGGRIYTGPVNTINTSLRPKLGIPEGFRVVMVLKVGHIDKSVDATSAASTRKPVEEIVNYR